MKTIGELRKRTTSTSNCPTSFLFLANRKSGGENFDCDNKPSRFDNDGREIWISSSLVQCRRSEAVSSTSDEGELNDLVTVPLLSEEFEKKIERDRSCEIFHASIELLNFEAVDEKFFGLLTLVQNVRKIPNEDSYSASVHLLESSNDSLTQANILETIEVVEAQSHPLHLHLLPAHTSEPSSLDDLDLGSSATLGPQLTFKNHLVVLYLGESIVVHQIETNHLSTFKAVKIIHSVRVTKNFWWAEWSSDYQFLAFTHDQRRAQSFLLDEDERSTPEGESQQTKSILSVFQFHQEFQRESVINFPLESSIMESGKNLWCFSMVSSPTVLSIDNPIARSLRLLSHSTGVVCLFHLRKPDQSYFFSYSTILLHHNKTITVNIPESGTVIRNRVMDVDVCLCHNGEYLIVLAWPYFFHILDIGVAHEPSHHFVLPMEIVFPNLISSNSLFQSFCPKLMDDDSIVHLLLTDSRVQSVELNASFFISVLQKYSVIHGSDLNLSLATIHSLLLHFNNTQAVKKLIGKISKKTENLYLTKIFQEFVIANAHCAIRKDILPDMGTFLHFIPYCQIPPERTNSGPPVYYEGKTYSLYLENNSSKISTMLLSPSQRIFSHHVSDIWTSLWETNALLINSRRFCHKTIADKLLLSLQCYKPEALSRASTPMSPLSPMVCGSLGDIVLMFGRKSQELQLPFVEHESCTANKQEYIFSINLRELSMHLLKERRDWPLACHAIAGKYVNALTDASRLLCHLISLTTIPQLDRPIRPKDKGFPLIDSLTAERQLRLFILYEHYALAHGKLGCQFPQGFTPFFAYLGYRVLRFQQFLWHVRSGTFDLQIDMVKTIMADLSDLDEKDVEKKLRLILFLPKSRASRVLNGWSHPISIGLRARQHASDLLSGVPSPQSRKSHFNTQVNRVRSKANSAAGVGNTEQSNGSSALDTFYKLLTAKANASDIDLSLLTEATMLSMK